ncbi:MAG: hypothetical protein K1X52_04130 [Pyrinomonadaceae bacterium]|nr:hypothetical protein [Pyrinomonadaceae bacterium]
MRFDPGSNSKSCLRCSFAVQQTLDPLNLLGILSGCVLTSRSFGAISIAVSDKNSSRESVCVGLVLMQT